MDKGVFQVELEILVIMVLGVFGPLIIILVFLCNRLSAYMAEIVVAKEKDHQKFAIAEVILCI